MNLSLSPHHLCLSFSSDTHHLFLDCKFSFYIVIIVFTYMSISLSVCKFKSRNNCCLSFCSASLLPKTTFPLHTLTPTPTHTHTHTDTETHTDTHTHTHTDTHTHSHTHRHTQTHTQRHTFTHTDTHTHTHTVTENTTSFNLPGSSRKLVDVIFIFQINILRLREVNKIV